MLKPYRTPQTYFRRRDRNQNFEHENDADVSLIFENVINSRLEDVKNNRLVNFYKPDVKTTKGARL